MIGETVATLDQAASDQDRVADLAREAQEICICLQKALPVRRS